jgi:hypothetical protein
MNFLSVAVLRGSKLLLGLKYEKISHSLPFCDTEIHNVHYTTQSNAASAVYVCCLH